VLRCLKPASLAAAIALVFAYPLSTSAAGCLDMVKRHAILASDAVDPDVFVWNRRASLLDYSSGVWMATSSVVQHTLLEKPGTKAFVISCVPNNVRSRFSGTVQDAVGLHIVSGPDRGRYGWAVEEDVHRYR
jgi:hypothetical protein